MCAFFIAPHVSADPYFNSSEAGCNPASPNPNFLFCEDFETSGVANSPNGHWYGEDADQASSSGGIGVRTKGWGGTIFHNPITPAGAAICGNAGAVQTNCASHQGTLVGNIGSGNMADHSFIGSAVVTEFYVRYYYKLYAGYQFGWEKHLTINKCCAPTGGIDFGNLHLRGAQSGTRPQVVSMSYQIPPTTCAEDSHRFMNQGNNISFDGRTDRWYFVELHIKLSTPPCNPDGVLELWVDDCGASGTACTGTPTLRMRHTNVKFSVPDTSNGSKVGTIWFENWGNLGSIGVASRDQIIASRTGPIGFMAVGPDTTPPVRSNLAPTGTLAAGTTQTNISLTTDENATCRYMPSAGVAYASMTNTFSGGGGLSHSAIVTGLFDGGTFTYWPRCIDALGNANTTDGSPITFSVASPPQSPSQLKATNTKIGGRATLQ